MEIRRERDPELINRISQMPGVREFIGEPKDCSPLFEGRCNGCIVLSNGEDGVQVFEMTPEDHRAWQVISIFAPTCRGKRALETARANREYMSRFADIIFGPVPDTLRHAKWFYRQLGGEPVEAVKVGDETYIAGEGETLFAFRLH